MSNKIFLKYKEMIYYLIVGILTTIVSLGSYYMCVLTLLSPNNIIELQMANIISWLCSVTFAYFANRKFVFNSKNHNKLKEAGMFYISRFTSLLLDMLIMYLLVIILSMNDKIAKIGVQFIVLVINYFFSKCIVFKK